jgi:hypothetical protein
MGSFDQQQIVDRTMFTSDQYRAKAEEYAELAAVTRSENERREFIALQKSFSALADNEKWLTDNYEATIKFDRGGIGKVALAAEEEHVLRCLGAALVMEWNSLPAWLRRELFDNAGAMGALVDATALRGKIARFLHKHKDDNAMSSASHAKSA